MSKAASSYQRSSWTRRRRERAQRDEKKRNPYSRTRNPTRQYVSDRGVNESDEESSLELETESGKGRKGFISTVLSYVPFVRNLLYEESFSEEEEDVREEDEEEEQEEEAQSSIKKNVTDTPESVADQESHCSISQNEEIHDQVEKKPVCLGNTFERPEECSSENVTPTISKTSQKAFVFDRCRKRSHEPNLDEIRKLVKQQKTITWDEYERLSRDLRALVQDENSAMPRPKPSMSEPILVKSHRQPILAAYGARNRFKRLLSSRLLTHGHRDAASRNAYSTAIAERVMNCLQKLESPMEEERKKPTVGCSVSWANYQLTRTQKKLEREAISEHTTTQPEEIPPTKTLPAIFSIPNATPTTALKPPSPVVSETNTPIVGVKTPEKKIEHAETHFKFTAPVSVTDSTETQVDRKLKFLFSPPPTERRPPRKASSQNAFSALEGPQPLSFLPALPKMHGAKLPVAPPSKAHTNSNSIRESNQKEEQAAKNSQPTSSPSIALETSNPLARFMKLASGQWKCPTCAVSNADALIKCPCCDTENPSAIQSKTSEKTDLTPPSSTFTFGVPSKMTTPSNPTPANSSPDRIDSLETSEALSPPKAPDSLPFVQSAISASDASTSFKFGIQAPSTVSFSAPASNFSFATKIEPSNPSFSFGMTTAPVPQTAEPLKTTFSGLIPVQSTQIEEVTTEATQFEKTPIQNAIPSSRKCKRPLESFNESIPSKKTVNEHPPVEEKKASFTFGSLEPTADTNLHSKSSETTPSSTKPAFTFGSSLPNVTSFSNDSVGSTKTTFNSGFPTTSFSSDSASGSKTFGSSNNNGTPSCGTVFGSNATKQPEAFVFSAPAAIETPVKEQNLPKKPSFTFGSSTENVATAPNASFGAFISNANAPKSLTSNAFSEKSESGFQAFGNNSKNETSAPFGISSENSFLSSTFGQLPAANNAFGSLTPAGNGNGAFNSQTLNSAPNFGSSASANVPPTFGSVPNQFAPGNNAPTFGNVPFGGNPNSSVFGNSGPFSTFGSNCMERPASGPAFGTSSIGMNGPNSFSIGSAPTQPPQRAGRRILRARMRGKR